MTPKEDTLKQWKSEAEEEKSIPQMDYLDERILKLIDRIHYLERVIEEKDESLKWLSEVPLDHISHETLVKILKEGTTQILNLKPKEFEG